MNKFDRDLKNLDEAIGTISTVFDIDKRFIFDVVSEQIKTTLRLDSDSYEFKLIGELFDKIIVNRK